MRTFWIKVTIHRRIVTPIDKANCKPIGKAKRKPNDKAKRDKHLDPFIETTRTFLAKQKAATEGAAKHIMQRTHLDDNPSHWSVCCEVMSASEVKEFQDEQLDLESIKFE